jgi:hypothetical protein
MQTLAEGVRSAEVPELSRSDMERIVSIFILRYFEDKNIPESVDLCCRRYLDMVIGTNICDGVDMAYSAMDASGRFDTSASDHLIGEEIRYVIKTLSQIRKRVPAEFAAGVLLMHLEIVEGVPL